MAGIRLIPITDESLFPYDEVLEKLRTIEGVELQPADLSKMIEAGRRIGWSDEMIAANEELAARGKCYDFRQQASPYLRGTLYEDNVFFIILDQGHEEICQPTIEAFARELGVRVIKY